MQENILIAFGKRVKQLRSERGWSQEKLAEKTGFHRTYIGMIERGERNIGLKNIEVFASIFRVNLSELLDD
ncbi:MAG: helix-turn-helix domain-containing protein [Bacteroidota bacterium]